MRESLTRGRTHSAMEHLRSRNIESGGHGGGIRWRMKLSTKHPMVIAPRCPQTHGLPAERLTGRRADPDNGQTDDQTDRLVI